MTEKYNPDSIRKDFPVTQNMTYLDSGYQSPLSRPVREAIESYLGEASAMAGPKAVWLKRAELTRKKLARLIGATAQEIAFTKNTSEALNIAANALPLEAGDNVVMIHGDHPNNTYAFLNLRRKGVEIRFIDMTEVIDGSSFSSAVDKRTRAISMSHVTFHAGHRFDVESVGAFCRERGIYFVVDAMQSIGVMPVDVKAMNATFVASGTHKGLLVPHGLGFLYWNSEFSDLQPTYLAVASLAHPPADLIARPQCMDVAPDARRFELGNYNLPAVHALGRALEVIDGIGIESIEAHVQELGDRLIEGMDRLGIAIVGPRQRERRSHIYVPALSADIWLEYFEGNSIRVSPERDGIRVSLALFNTTEDIDRFIEVTERGLLNNIHFNLNRP